LLQLQALAALLVGLVPKLLLQIAAAAKGHRSHSSRGRTVLFGGVNLTDTWEWDGENWTQMADTGPFYDNAAMAYDAQRNKTVYFGAGTWGWDGRNWTQLADHGPPMRSNYAMAYDSKRQRIVLFGGVLRTGPMVADTWLWDGSAWTQATAATGPSARGSHAMAYDSTHDQTVLFGGFGTNGKGLGDTWIWDGSGWTQVSDFGATPCGLASLAFKGDSVALLGGSSSAPGFSPVPLGSTWTWDGKNWTLRQDFGPPARFAAAMSYDSKRSALVLFGGWNGASTSVFFADTWEHSEGP
jgi:hypothetical protein